MHNSWRQRGILTLEDREMNAFGMKKETLTECEQLDEFDMGHRQTVNLVFVLNSFLPSFWHTRCVVWCSDIFCILAFCVRTKVHGLSFPAREWREVSFMWEKYREIDSFSSSCVVLLWFWSATKWQWAFKNGGISLTSLVDNLSLYCKMTCHYHAILSNKMVNMLYFVI